ncbi:MAG: ATPase, partial [Clostridiales bacterium]|nr:ATPase [Clostridiales bacterium]
LTQNKMTVVDTYGSDVTLLAKAMALCSDASVTDGEAVGEPTECALVNFALSKGLNKNLLQEETPRIAEAPFDSLRKMMSTLHQTANGVVQYPKGAPDEVLKRCTHVLIDGKTLPLTEELRTQILAENKRMADKALRVLAAATRVYTALPDDVNAEKIEMGLEFVGLCGMIDPVRDEVAEAIKRAREAGIRPIMITGDHIDTAVAI